MNSIRSRSSGGMLASIVFFCLLMLFDADKAMPEQTATYVNTEFRFELVHPSDWHVAPPGDVNRREKSARDDLYVSKSLPTMDRELFSVVRIIENRKRGRLSVRYCALPPDEYLAKSLEFMDKGLKSTVLNILEGPFEYSFHGRMYHMARFELDFGPGAVQSEVFVTSVDGGSLMFGITADQDRDFEELRDVFATLNFK